MPEVYTIFIRPAAQKQLFKLPKQVTDDLILVIQSLSINPRPPGSKKMKGRKGYRIRKGDYRILYDILDRKLIIDIIAAGHRKDIYE